MTRNELTEKQHREKIRRIRQQASKAASHNDVDIKRAILSGKNVGKDRDAPKDLSLLPSKLIALKYHHFRLLHIAFEEFWRGCGYLPKELSEYADSMQLTYSRDKRCLESMFAKLNGKTLEEVAAMNDEGEREHKDALDADPLIEEFA
jgi:hypothetical protein